CETQIRLAAGVVAELDAIAQADTAVGDFLQIASHGSGAVRSGRGQVEVRVVARCRRGRRNGFARKHAHGTQRMRLYDDAASAREGNAPLEIIRRQCLVGTQYEPALDATFELALDDILEVTHWRAS